MKESNQMVGYRNTTKYQKKNSYGQIEEQKHIKYIKQVAKWQK